MSIGERLREERNRLGFSQEKFGELGGVKRNSQAKYERGETVPDLNYMEKIGKAGADVIYIVSGQKVGKKKYDTASDTLDVVLDVQYELGLSFDAAQIRSLSALAFGADLDADQLKEVIINSYKFHGVEIGLDSSKKPRKSDK